MRALKIITLVLTLVLAAAAGEIPAPEGTGADIAHSNLRLLLNSFVAVGEGEIESALRELKLLSATDEVQSGDWKRMKGLLEEFGRTGTNPVSVWFAGSDGACYTPEEDLIDCNLPGRRHLPGLMTGGQVVGDLDIGSPPGKRNATVAVPVHRSGEVVGAVGVTLSLEKMSRLLDEKMGLPEDMIFYALDPKGRTALHRSSALFFRYPSDVGSRTLEEMIPEMLSKAEGVLRYEFYGDRAVFFRKSPLTGWIYSLGIPAGKTDEPGEQLPPILSGLEKDISERLEKIDRSLSGVAMRLSEAGLDSAGTRKLLAELCSIDSSILRSATAEPGGRIVIAEPEIYAADEGGDSSAQEQSIRLRESKKPFFSSVIQAADGFDAIDICYPIYSPGGDFAGSVSILIRPDSLISDIAAPLLSAIPADLRVMQKDGRILFSSENDEIGRMLPADPVFRPFPHLIALGEMISREKSGSGRYEFRERGADKQVKKLAHWTTFDLHGTEWRIVLSQTRDEDGSAVGPIVPALGVPTHDDSFRKLAEDPALKEALSGNSTGRIQEIFRNFHEDHDGLYSIQWVDARGINRCGYPEEKVLVDFDFTTLADLSARQILLAVWEEEESSFDAALTGGEVGSFFMVPVYDEDEYLGMIYTIQLRP